ncbi:MAG: hypothetical protein GY792_20025 [Gammaproteobacteria bacterium]|nr:hypothetical protein [Gammaproteobacteria bacterium]
MTTLFINCLTVIDASLLDARRGLLGQSWQLDVALEGLLDHQGMLLDFGQVKKQIKRCVDEEFDHKLLVPTAYSGCRVAHRSNRTEISFQLESGTTVEHYGPANACALIDQEFINSESVAAAIMRRLKPMLPDNVKQAKLHLHTEDIQGACYQYSHGLKYHEGNCQRIAHGHRSRIQIFQNSQRSPQLESTWALRWQDIYLGNRSDLKREFTHNGALYYHFGYTSRQGQFELILPEKQCYLIDTDSTVENLALHICTTLQREHPESDFRVVAFEGVDKGAISESG